MPIPGEMSYVSVCAKDDNGKLYTTEFKRTECEENTQRIGNKIAGLKSSKELIDEGSRLNHCVAQYISKMANGVTAIFFVRNTEKPNKSFYTLELCGKRVVQCRTKNNKSYSDCPEVKAFVDEWMESIVLKPHRKRKTA